MNKKTHIIKRLNLLYGIFFIVVILSVIAGIIHPNFQEGFRNGYESAQKEPGIHTRFYSEIPVVKSSEKFDIQLETPTEGISKLSANVAKINLRAEGQSIPASHPMYYILISCSLLCYLAIFIIILITLLSLRKSIKRGDVFNRDIIKLTRAIGILLIFSSLAYNCGFYLETGFISRLLSNSEWQVVPHRFSFQEIITGLLILVIGEIFTIGYAVTEEQKLTI